VGPFIAASLSLAVLSIPLVWWRNKTGYTISIIVGLLGLVSFGPHKILAGSAGQLFPAIMVGTVLSVALIISSVASWRKKSKIEILYKFSINLKWCVVKMKDLILLERCHILNF
jgi:hypothetical protein